MLSTRDTPIGPLLRQLPADADLRGRKNPCCIRVFADSRG